MRKLASIRKITEIRPIVNADAIEVAVVDGWSVVTRKGEYTVGDFAVYFEIDSWIPEEMAPFLSKGGGAKTYEGIVGNRLRTVKLRGQVSQGLLLPVSNFIDGSGADFEGLDLSENLGIVKYDPPIPACLAGEVEGMFPAFMSKTDQERVQNLISMTDWFVGEWEVTMKLDGSSMTLFTRAGTAGVCSRNLHLKDNEANNGNTLVTFARGMNYSEALPAIADKVGFDFALQGEIMGPGIQNNREKFTKPRFFVFDVYNISENRYLNASERRAVLNLVAYYTNSVEHVPVLIEGFLITEDQVDVDWFLAMAELPSINHKFAEGIVFKNLKDGDKSFKVISNRFLLKEE